MNKALPWNINGVGFDAREAAREAARRQGQSLGEWLHGVIADRSAELGLAEKSFSDQDRVEAVTSKLERLSGRSAAFDRRIEDDEPGASRGARVADDREKMRSPRRRDLADASDAPRRRPSRPPIEETEFLLEEAIDAMERRSERSERRTETALTSIIKMLESSEERRETERESVVALTRKLNTIEAKLSDRDQGADQNPVKGALARLEARLESIGRRASAESLSRQSAGPVFDKTPAGGDQALSRLESKLNEILEAVSVVPNHQTSTLAIVAGQNAASGGDRRLGDAIAAISQRQRELDGGSPRSPTDLAREPRRDRSQSPTRRTLVPRQDQTQLWPLASLQQEIANLASKIDGVRDRTPQTAEHLDLAALRSEVAAIALSLRNLPPRESLQGIESSIRLLAERVESSRDNTPQIDLSPIETAVRDLCQSVADIDPHKTFTALDTQVRAIADKVDKLSAPSEPSSLTRLQERIEEVHDLVSATASRAPANDAISARVAALVDRVDASDSRPVFTRDLAEAADQIRAMIADGPGAAALEQINHRIDSLATKVEAAIQPTTDVGPTVDTTPLERLVRDLGSKMEAVQASASDDRSIDALQRQIEKLAATFEKSEGDTTIVSTLERSMKALFAHLEDTRASVETAAASAAREALRDAIDQGHRLSEPRADLSALMAMQDDADARTLSMLGDVHQTLEKVVDRLALLEGDLNDVRGLTKPAAPPEGSGRAAPRKVETRRVEPPTPSFSADPARDSLFREHRTEKVPASPEKKAAERADGTTHRADYIAAARRAAQAAQSELSIALPKRAAAGADVTQDASRAGLLAKSRDYVASHKRPVLFGVAAIFVVLGTLTIMQRLGLDPSNAFSGGTMPTRTADIPASPRPTGTDRPRVASVAAADNDLSPSELPKSAPTSAKTIAGTDPIQTASITALPAFAAQGASEPRQGAALPPGLKSMAEAGDKAAAYELGSRFAEGRGVPRDLTEASKWYAKAADRGLAPAQYRLASLYEKGLGVSQDKLKARSLYTEAADAGNPRAMHNLAVLLADGDGRPDYEGAATWFRRAAQYGVHDSQYNLAILLARGLGVQQSLVQSYQWFAVAAAQNDADAAKKRDEVGSKMNANDLAVAKALAAAFRPKTADLTAIEVQPPPGGWDSVPAPSHLNSARAKISSL